MLAIQLDFLEENDEVSILKRQYLDLFNRSENVRRGCFREIGELKKQIYGMKQEVDDLKKNR